MTLQSYRAVLGVAAFSAIAQQQCGPEQRGDESGDDAAASGGLDAEGGETGTGGSNRGGADNTGGTADTSGAAGEGDRGGGGVGGTSGSETGGNGATGGTDAPGGSPTNGGSGGMAGSGGSVAGGGSAGSGGITIAELVGSLDGHLIQFPCAGTSTLDNCTIDGLHHNGVRTPCSGSLVTVEHDYTVGGVPGARYNVTMHFYGIVQPKVCGSDQNLVREARTERPGNQDTGAEPSPWAYCRTPGCRPLYSSFEAYEIHVYDAANQEMGTYFLNSDVMEEDVTYVLNFEKTISVVGGGRIQVRVGNGDRPLECRMAKNCGPTGGNSCGSKARTVDISAANPQPPSGPPPGGLTQPGLGQSNDEAGEWLLIDVTAVGEPT